jgi:RNA polymerase sigma factor (sigma-70 family)
VNDQILDSVIERLRVDESDGTAWEELYKQLYPYLFSLFYRRFSANRFLAEEAVQETMMRFFKTFDFQRKVSSAGSLVGYIRLTAISVGSEAIRRHRASQQQEVNLEGEDPVGNPAMDENLLMDLERTVRLFTGRDARIASLLMEGKSSLEIARLLNIRNKTAYNAVSEIRGRLRRAIFS